MRASAAMIAVMAVLAAGGAQAQTRTEPKPMPVTKPTPIPPPVRINVAPPPPMPTTPPPPWTEGKPRGPIPASNPGNWIITDDYPSRALREEREGPTGFRLTVGADGLVTACEITSSSGSADLDERTCSLVTRRARFHPALNAEGQPTTGTYASRVNWVIPDDPEPEGPELAIPSHPMPGQSVITYTIGIDGRATDCRLVSGPDPADFMLWAMPCDYNQVFPVYRNAAGKAVPRKVRLVLSVTLPTATAPAPKRKKRR